MPDSFGSKQGLTPFVEISRSSSLVNSLHVSFVGSGRPEDLDENCQSGYRPIPFSCENQFVNSELVNQVWYKSTDRTTVGNILDKPGQYLSEENQNGNYNITIESQSASKTCFGYIPKKYLNDFYANTVEGPDFDFEHSISLCTDGTKTNIEGEVSCEGDIFEPGTNKYIVTVLKDVVQIVADNLHFVCNFPRNRENINILPWVYSSDNTVKQLELFGLGLPDINEDKPPCLWRYVKPIVNETKRCENFFYNKSRTVDLWQRVSDKEWFTLPELPGPGQYVSRNNTDGNYNITFDPTLYDAEKQLCFGYIPLEHAIELYTDNTLDSKSKSMAFCLDGGNGTGLNY